MEKWPRTSSSFGLNTLEVQRSVSTWREKGRSEAIPNHLRLSILLSSGKVTTRRAFGDHFGMSSVKNGEFHRVGQVVEVVLGLWRLIVKRLLGLAYAES